MRKDLDSYKELSKLFCRILPSREMERYSPMLEEHGLKSILETAYTVREDIKIIVQYASVVSNLESLELRDVHALLDDNIWLLNDHYRCYYSNVSLKNIIKSEMPKKYKRDERKRPDIICQNDFDNYIVVELKRPKHEIDLSDFNQLLSYIDIIEAHCPNWKLIEGYLVGAKFNETVRSDRLRKTGIYLLSYNEILTNVKFRYRRYLEAYKMEDSL